MEITQVQSTFSKHNGAKLEINRRKFWKFTKMWKLNNTLLIKQWVKEEIKRNQNTLKLMKMKHNIPNLCTKAISKGKLTAVNSYIKK